MTTYIIIGAIALVVILLCFALAVASFSTENFYEKLEENRQKQNSGGLSTVEFVQTINDSRFGGRLSVARCPQYEDHYSTGVVALSTETMHSNSLASLATVAHELGHARQDFEGDRLKKHWKLRRAGKFWGFFFMPIALVGVVLSALYLFGVLTEFVALVAGLILLAISVLIFAFTVFLKYKEIQIEKEASKFAIEFLQEVLSAGELSSCKEFLDSARLTYWAVLFRTLLGWTFLTGKNKMFD
jgi:Zn-dependent membrane protease YugP